MLSLMVDVDGVTAENNALQLLPGRRATRAQHDIASLSKCTIFFS